MRMVSMRITIENLNILANLKKKMEIARDPYSMAYLGLIYKKKRRRKSHAWAPLIIRLLLAEY
jgi:hypothetical protein